MPRKMARQTLERHAGACYAGSRPYLGSGLLGSPENRYNLPHFRVHPGNPGQYDLDQSFCRVCCLMECFALPYVRYGMAPKSSPRASSYGRAAGERGVSGPKRGASARSGRTERGTIVARAFACLADWARFLRVACVVAASVAVGWLLLLLTPQAQDLFAHHSSHAPELVRDWGLFYLCAIFFWILPVYCFSTIVTSIYNQNVARAAPAQLPVSASTLAVGPALTAGVCFLAITWAQLQAADAVEAFDRTNDLRLAPLSLLSILSVDLQRYGTRGALFLAVGIVIARTLRCHPAKCFRGSGAVLLFLLLALVVWTSAFLAAGFMFTLQSGLTSQVLHVLPMVTVWAGLATVLVLLQLSTSPGPVAQNIIETLIVISFVSSLAALLAFLLVDPVLIARILNRAPLLVVGLGIWIGPLTFLRLVSLRFRIPAVMIFFGVLVLASWLLTGMHDVRTLELQESLERPDLKTSVHRWAFANDCVIGSAERGCPPPVIVLASGGASRAAFFTGVALGRLMDQSQAPGSPHRAFHRQLFAVSAVSGGALATAVFQAALADAIQHRSADTPRGVLGPPCVDAARDRLWRGARNGDADITSSWEACLQALIAGDFLSPVIARLIGADVLSFGLWYGDRAVALERSWEDRYSDITGSRTLSLPLTSIRRRIMDADETNWLPHIIMNGTSTSTGRRIITTDLDFFTPARERPWDSLLCRGIPGRRAPEHCRRDFKDAYDLHELFQTSIGGSLRAPGDVLGWLRRRHDCRSCDVSLSTAASMSARFPLISPQGGIRGADGRIADYVVDGGYFENNGAIAAQELAERLVLEFGLRPVVVLITTDSAMPELECVSGKATLDYPDPGQTQALSVVVAPANTLSGTRTARGTLAAIGLCNFIKGEHGLDALSLPGFSFINIRVPQETTPISMSWWLSNHSQQRLVSELSKGHQDIARVLRLLETREATDIERVLSALQPGFLARAKPPYAGADIDQIRRVLAQQALGLLDGVIRETQTPEGGCQGQCAEAVMLRGHVHADDLNPSQDMSKAMEDFTLAEQDERASERAQRARAVLLEKREEHQEAINVLSRLLARNPEDGAALMSRGVNRELLRDLDGAVADYSAAAALNPSNAMVENFLGNVYRAKGEIAESVSHYSRAITINPRYAKAYNNRAWSYKLLGEFQLGLVDARKALDLDPSDIHALDTRGQRYEAARDLERAAKDYARILWIDPKNADAAANLARVKDQRGGVE